MCLAPIVETFPKFQNIRFKINRKRWKLRRDYDYENVTQIRHSVHFKLFFTLFKSLLMFTRFSKNTHIRYCPNIWQHNRLLHLCPLCDATSLALLTKWLIFLFGFLGVTGARFGLAQWTDWCIPMNLLMTTETWLHWRWLLPEKIQSSFYFL